MAKKHDPSESYRVEDICFGFDRDTDERSLRMFLRRFAADEVLDVIVPRLQDEEFEKIVAYCNSILHRHLNKKEYHRLFLWER